MCVLYGVCGTCFLVYDIRTYVYVVPAFYEYILTPTWLLLPGSLMYHIDPGYCMRLVARLYHRTYMFTSSLRTRLRLPYRIVYLFLFLFFFLIQRFLRFLYPSSSAPSIANLIRKSKILYRLMGVLVVVLAHTTRTLELAEHVLLNMEYLKKENANYTWELLQSTALDGNVCYVYDRTGCFERNYAYVRADRNRSDGEWEWLEFKMN